MKDINFITADACSLPLKNSSVDLIITSPPYFGMDPYRYGGDYKKQINNSDSKMLKLLVKSTKEMSRVIKDSGSIIINIGHNNSMPYLYISEILKKTDLKLLNPPFIVNHSDEEFKKPKEYFNASYTMWFHLSKNIKNIYHNPFIFKRYSDPIWNLNIYDNTEEFSRVKDAGYVLDTYSSEMAKRFIEIFSRQNSVVLDPFGGSGVAAIQAYKNGRKGISIDISPEQTELAKKRFKIETGEKYE